MRKLIARDEYDLPLNENDVVYQDYDEFIDDIREQALELEASCSVETGDEIRSLFESQEANWYIRLDENSFVQVNPKTVRKSKGTADLASRVYLDVFLDDSVLEYLKKINKQ